MIGRMSAAVALGSALVGFGSLGAGAQTTSFNDNFESHSGSGSTTNFGGSSMGGVDVIESLPAVGSYDSNSTAFISRRDLPEGGTSDRLAVHNCCGGTAFGIADTNLVTVGTPVHLEFIANLGSHDNVGSTYRPTVGLFGTGGITNPTLSIELATPGTPGGQLTTTSIRDDGDNLITELDTPPGNGFDYLIEIDYVVGENSYEVTIDTFSTFTVTSMANPGGDVAGWSMTQGSGAFFFSMDNVVLTSSDPQPITIVKDPPSQSVQSGSNAVFTITVYNSTTQQLSNVTVSDAAVPDCAGNLGDLAAGASTSYVCTVTNVTAAFSNTASVVATPPTGPDVNDTSDPAVVVVTVPPVAGALFQGDLEAQVALSPPSGAAVVGTWVAGATATVQDRSSEGLGNVLQVFGPAGQHQAFGQATQSSPLGTPLHFEWNLLAGTHNNGGILYTPTALLYGPTTSDMILGVRLSYPGANFSPPGTNAVIQAWNGSEWVDTGLFDPLDGFDQKRLYEIEYAAGSSSFGLTVAGVGSTNVKAVGSTTGAVEGIGFTRGTSSGTFGQADDFLLTRATNEITITKTPPFQLVSVTEDAQFTITVYNTGTQLLSNVTVTDPIAPDCAGSLGNLAAGASTSYVCTVSNVTEGFINTVTVTASPPTGPDVSASDCAVVDVIGVPFSTVMTEAAILTYGNSKAGAKHYLQSAGDLPAGDWTNRGVRVRGDGSTQTVLDPAGAPGTDRSYRLTGD